MKGKGQEESTGGTDEVNKTQISCLTSQSFCLFLDFRLPALHLDRDYR